MKLIPGLRFGRLVLQRKSHSNRRTKRVYWHCLCDCGTLCIGDNHSLNHGKKKSCGCLQRDIKHGAGKRRAKDSWDSMRDRCLSPKHPHFPLYGGRGIAICSRWARFENFYADLGDRPEGMTLGRIDNEGGYEPGNCRWETALEQQDNRRTTRWVTISGEPETLRAACLRLGVSRSVVYERLKLGWSELDAFAKPVRPKKPNDKKSPSPESLPTIAKIAP